MLTKRIIPCLDVTKGKVVKGTNFVDLQDAGDPVELAVRYYNEGADEITFLDISATLEDRKTAHSLVEEISKNIFIPLTVGGGIKKLEDAEVLFRNGADKISINSAAIANPELITEIANKFGSQAVILAIDTWQNPYTGKYLVHTRSGTSSTEIEVVDWAKQVTNLGAGEILLTSINADGTKEGYDLELTKKVSDAVAIPVIASGGAGNSKHIADVLTLGSASAALVASLFHFNELTIKEVKEHLINKNIPTRVSPNVY